MTTYELDLRQTNEAEPQSTATSWSHLQQKGGKKYLKQHDEEKEGRWSTPKFTVTRATSGKNRTKKKKKCFG